mmetsp:Transcript_20512/g.28660  ORF Transcript_20512/g.28660 Transcript_20512/m.28660 type:complete len:177 (+) Transcript_20512:109-639(+)|eukprot:CAMPEP_0184479478 /NCGR_PEP_ID=MMETSP0113_2-20130426/1194_1 /TAXON_ID=91329 /ORGANISM="Norrisiella sphaerica, Strain BC52" /LENGTH=176 /DNA_ID=CAMNT_0026857577 /DNA_START=65 /DNA_END=595 /DNA_ORIENTATION=+
MASNKPEDDSKKGKVEEVKKEEEAPQGVAFFTEKSDPVKPLRKVVILDRSKEFQKRGEGSSGVKEEKEEEVDEKMIRNAFQKWSLDNKSIGRTEVISVLKKAGIMPTAEDLDSIIKGIDTDNNGKINWEDWVKAYIRKSQRGKKTHVQDDISEMEESLRRKRGQHIPMGSTEPADN